MKKYNEKHNEKKWNYTKLKHVSKILLSKQIILKKLCDKWFLKTYCKFKGSPILLPQNFELDFGQGLM